MRILRLWRCYAAMDLTWITRGPRLFVVYYLSDLLLNVAMVSGTLLLAERFNGIGPWSKPQIIFLLGYGTLVNGLTEMLFGWNLLMISRRVGRGQFDHMLIQPIPLWMSLLTEGFLPFSGSAIVLTGCVLSGWAMAHLHMQITAAWLCLLALNVIGSVTIVLAFSYFWGSLAFWAPRGAEEISSSALKLLSQLKSFPLDGLRPAMLSGLLTLLPVGFIAWFPVRALLGIDRSLGGVLVTPAVALLAAGLAVYIFKRGLRQYGRTGSQRYLSFGHRS
jgi:ABC-2 type transport system permease protein